MITFINSELAKVRSIVQRTKTHLHTSMRIAVASALLAGLIVTPASAQLREGALGVWAEEDGEAYIEITQCQDKLCGHIVWLRQPLDDNGQPLLDENNPNPALRTRPILGLLIMAGLQSNDDDSYLEGKVYNSDNGKIYDIYLTPKGNVMEVEGCLMKYICLTQTWTRVR